MISKKCPTREQLLADVLSPISWAEIAAKYGYKSSKFLETKARKWMLPNKVRKYVNGFTAASPSHDRLYHIWFDMKRRCYQPQNKRWEKYGGRGIKVCPEWLDNFQTFFDWSMANGYDDNLTIDRIDMDGDYSPENCRWADKYQQANNRSNNHLLTYKGETKTMMEWSRSLGINYTTLRRRIRAGWSVENAIEIPIGGGANDNQSR